ncbi:MAG: hypothetical protein HY924_16745 [Elusimicrobia bacterium]|nr:hypothetical protein [Elusimicrobiota bacterium]
MTTKLSTAMLVLTMCAVSSEAATTRAVHVNRGTFRAVSVQGNSASASPSPAASFSTPVTAIVSQPANVSQPMRGFSPAGTNFNGSKRGFSDSNPRFNAFRTSWPIRKEADPAPAAEEGPQPVVGALIRTAGSGYKVGAASPSSIHAVDGGSQFIEHQVGGQAIEGVGHRLVPYDPSKHGASGASPSSPLGTAISPGKY